MKNLIKSIAISLALFIIDLAYFIYGLAPIVEDSENILLIKWADLIYATAEKVESMGYYIFGLGYENSTQEYLAAVNLIHDDNWAFYTPNQIKIIDTQGLR